MRIGFLGKGGSGKSTLCALFSLYLEEKDYNVLAVDADLNVHQQQLLGLEGTQKYLYPNLDEIKNYVLGNRKDLPNNIVTTSTPPSDDAGFIKVDKDDPFLQKFALQRGKLNLLTLGTYQKDDPGCACYHGMLGAWCLTANHILDKQSDYVNIDATAGIDNIATPLFHAYDVNFFAVEPTLKGVKVFLDFDEVAQKHGMRVPVVLNKITSEDDTDFIKAHIPEERIVATIYKSKYMKRFDQGQKDALQHIIEENREAFDAIKAYADATPKDWGRYYSKMVEAHNKFAKSWHNDFHKVDLTVPENSNFKYEDVLNRATGNQRTPC